MGSTVSLSSWLGLRLSLCGSVFGLLGLRPLANGEHRLPLRGDLWPLASRFDLRRLGLWPLAARFGLRPLASRIGLQPLASGLGLRPLASRLGLRSLASRLSLRSLTSSVLLGTKEWVAPSLSSGLGLRSLVWRLGLRFLARLWQLETGEGFLAFLFYGIVWVNVGDDG